MQVETRVLFDFAIILRRVVIISQGVGQLRCLPSLYGTGKIRREKNASSSFSQVTSGHEFNALSVLST